MVRHRETDWTEVGRGGGGAGLPLYNLSRNRKLQQPHCRVGLSQPCAPESHWGNRPMRERQEILPKA